MVLNDSNTSLKLEVKTIRFEEDKPRVKTRLSVSTSNDSHQLDKCLLSNECRKVTINDTVVVSSRPRSTNKRRVKKYEIELKNLFNEDVPDYPEAEISELLKKTPESLKNFFNELDTPLDPNRNLSERIAYNDDYIGSEREEPICRTVTRNVYPREAKLDNTRVFVPNNDQFMQVISVDICQNPNEECNHLRGILPDGFSSTCTQKYAFKKLLYLEPTDERMDSGLFRYPSCCSCNIKTIPFDLRSFSAGHKLLNTANMTSLSMHNTSYVEQTKPVSNSSKDKPEATTLSTLGIS